MNTYGYVGGNPILKVDILGLSEEDVNKIIDSYLKIEDEMTKNGERTDPGILNNIQRSLYDASDGKLGHNYLGCGEQAGKVKDGISGDKYDDQWSFELDGSNNLLQYDYDHSISLNHWWVVGRSNNPKDPIIILDPHRNRAIVKK